MQCVEICRTTRFEEAVFKQLLSSERFFPFLETCFVVNLSAELMPVAVHCAGVVNDHANSWSYVPVAICEPNPRHPASNMQAAPFHTAKTI